MSGNEEPTGENDRESTRGAGRTLDRLDRTVAKLRRRLVPVETVLRDSADRAREVHLGFIAAAIAHYAFVSLIPLLLVVLAVGSFVGGEQLVEWTIEQVAVFLSPSGQKLVETALTSDVSRGPAGLVGLLVLLWSALKVFRGIDIGFSRLYGTAEDEGLADQLRDGLLVFATIGPGLAAFTVVTTAVAVVDRSIVSTLAPFLLVLTLVVAFFPLYYVFPDVPMSPVQALPGAAVAAAGWTLLSAGFSYYTSVAGSFALYGVLGAVLLLVTWLYLGALVLLVGGLLNVALDDAAPVGTGSYKSPESDGSTE